MNEIESKYKFVHRIAMMLLVKELLGQQQDMLDRLWNINRDLKWP